MSDDWLSPIMAAWRLGHPSLSMATRKRVGSGLPIATGSAPPATAIAAAKAPQPGSKSPGPTGNRLSRLTAKNDAPAATARAAAAAAVIEVEVDPDHDRLGLLPALDRNRSVTGRSQYLGKIFRADHQHRNGPDPALDFPAYQIKRREDLGRVRPRCQDRRAAG